MTRAKPSRSAGGEYVTDGNREGPRAKISFGVTRDKAGP